MTGSGIDIEVPAEFEEEEEGVLVRTLVDWQLFDEHDQLLSLDDLGEGKPLSKVTGYLIKPLPAELKMKICESLCTFGSMRPEDENKGVMVKEALVKEPVEVEWDTLKVGSMLDGYCDKTHKWHKARIVDIIREEPITYKVHFNGWKAKHDEWIQLGSSRLAPLGHFTDTVMMEVEKKPPIPWYENSAIFEMIAREASYDTSSSEKLEVKVFDIEDCCVDYTYANPSLSLISHEGPWYKVMSPLIPGGGYCDPQYNAKFEKYLEKFVAAAHCAFCLMDFLPSNRKLSFQNVVDEVDIRSGGRVDDNVILENSPFIIEQLSSLNAHDPSLDTEIPFEGSHFMNQLKKRSDQFMNLKHERKRRKRVVCKSLMDKSCGGSIDFSVKDTQKRGRPQKEEEAIPIKDSDYWKMQKEAGITPIPRPDPVTSNQLLPPENSNLLGDLLESWAILDNYREFLSLPRMSVEDVVSLIQDGDKSAYSKINDIHVQLIVPLLLQKNAQGHYCAAKNADESISVSSVMWKSIQQCCDTSSRPLLIIKQCLQQGSMWVEIVRILLSEKLNVFMPEYADNVMTMHSIVKELAHSKTYQTVISKDESLVDKTYPQDLLAILGAIESGYYEGGLRSDHQSDSQLFVSRFCLSLSVGSGVDAYCTVLNGWYPARVLSMSLTDRKVSLRFDGWGAGFDEEFSVDDIRMVPRSTFSLRPDVKEVTPDKISSQVWADLEDKSRADNLRKMVRPLNYVGHEAIAQDVIRVLSRSDAASSELLEELLEEFRQSYDSKSFNDYFCEEADGLTELVIRLGQTDYSAIPLTMKIKLLCWLCEEMVACPSAKTYLDNIMEQKISAEKSKAPKQNENDDSKLDSSNPKFCAKRSAEEMLDGSSQAQTDFFRCFKLRLYPIGKDRNNSVYWTFENDQTQPLQRVFCEDYVHGNWAVYSTQSDVETLLTWLCKKGINENHLIQAITSIRKAKPSIPEISSNETSRSRLFCAPASVFIINVMLGEDGKLGAGVKDLDGRVIISTFKPNEMNKSCARDSGMLICDQLVSLDGQPIHDIPSLQEAMCRSKARNSGNMCKLSFLVMRFSDPVKSMPAIEIALNTDVEFRADFHRQQETSDDSMEVVHPINTERVYCESLISLFMEMLYGAAILYPTSSRLGFRGHMWYIKKISSIVFRIHGGDDKASKDLLACMQSCLLDMEFALSQTGRGLVESWFDSRFRYKWAHMCSKACTVSALTFCAFCFYVSIDWSEVSELSSLIDYSKLSKFVPKQLQNFIPKVNDRVLFFGKEYFSAMCTDPMLECVGNAPDFTTMCAVLDVKIYKGGGVKSSIAGIPHARVLLQTIDDNLEDSCHPRLLEEPNYKRINRLLNLASYVVLALPESAPFSSAVSVDDCPNYYDVVTSPMHMGIIQQKISETKYTCSEEYLRDIDLIRSNCILYCTERFPALLPLAEKLHSFAYEVTRRLFVQSSSKELSGSAPPKSHPTKTGSFRFCHCIPLSGAFDSFVVSKDKYLAASKTAFHLEDNFFCNVKEAVPGEDVSRPTISATKRKGTIIDCKTCLNPSSLVAWREFEVEWEDEYPNTHLFDSVNPWEIVISKK